jgi:phosphoserine phosphatase RsbU/P
VNSRIELEPGDRLIFYTDGITEAANAAREFYGDHGFLEFIQQRGELSAEQFTAELIHDVRRWSPAQDDDLTVVAVHFAR